MRLIGWAIALAAAGLTPAAAQRRRAAPPDCRAARLPAGDAARRRPRRTPNKPDAAPARDRPRQRRPHASRRRASASPTAARASSCRSLRSARKPRRSTTTGCCRCARSISALRPGPAGCGDGPLPPRREPDAVAQLAQYDDRGDLDARAGAHPGRDRDPVDPAAAPPIFAAAGRRDGQGHRPPMVLVVRAIPTMA